MFVSFTFACYLSDRFPASLLHVCDLFTLDILSLLWIINAATNNYLP